MRYGELLAVVSEPLLQYIVDNVNKLVVENSMLLLIVAIITHAQGKLSIQFVQLLYLLIVTHYARSLSSIGRTVIDETIHSCSN